MQRAENQVSGFGGGQCQADGFGVAHLADKDNVGVFAQCGTQRVGEAEGVLVQLALVNQGFLLWWTNSIGSSMVRMCASWVSLM